MKHAPSKPLRSVMLLALALSLTACASKPPTPPAVSPRLPPAPSLSTPIPSLSYSENAAAVIKSWRQRLTGTVLMRAPSETPGQ